MNKRNLIIASLSVIALISGVRYKSHVDFWSFHESCQEARQVRRDAARLLGKTIMSGQAGMSSEVTVLIRDANDFQFPTATPKAFDQMTEHPNARSTNLYIHARILASPLCQC